MYMGLYGSIPSVMFSGVENLVDVCLTWQKKIELKCAKVN